jgi:hypothetical protein
MHRIVGSCPTIWTFQRTSDHQVTIEYQSKTSPFPEHARIQYIPLRWTPGAFRGLSRISPTSTLLKWRTVYEPSHLAEGCDLKTVEPPNYVEANMASVSSLDKDLRQMRLDKYTPQAAKEVRDWIEEILGERLPNGDLLEALRDGLNLCRKVESV